MPGIARRAFVATVVAVAVIAAALALWQLRLLLGLIFLAVTIAAAMRPGVEGLARQGVPRPAGVALHYLGLLAVIGLFLWLAVPAAIDQTQAALGNVPTSAGELRRAANHSHGLKHEILVGIEKRLRDLPSGSQLIRPALDIGRKAVEVLVGIFFTFAAAAYWIFERERAMRIALTLLPRGKRKVARDTWELIDLKLGAFVRGQLLLIVFVATLLSFLFWLVGEPFWLLLGSVAGVVELLPVIGPLAAGLLAVGAGLTDSWQVALAAALCVLAVRMLEDYMVVPRVLGHAVGLSPLYVLVSVSAFGLLLGGIFVLLAVPLAAVLATILDVVALRHDPSKQDVPALLFPAKEREVQ